MYEWRMLVVGSVGYYFLVRLGKDYGPGASQISGKWDRLSSLSEQPGKAVPQIWDRPYGPSSVQDGAPSVRWAWRLLDALAAGAVLHSGIVLWGYVFADQFVATEGVRRVMSPVYGSPNNLSLFLDRVWPILLAVTVLPGPASSPGAKIDLRRWLYGLGWVIVSIALYLTYSNGALLVGLPVGVATMALLYGLRRQRHGRRLVVIAIGSMLLIALSLLPLSQTARFQNVLELSPGTTAYFRVKLWQSSLNMLRDHWLLGVGLDNFLYVYRTRYILPEAWQEPNLNHPHNIVLDYVTRLGLGGLVILIWLQVAFWRQAWRLYRQWPAPLVLGLMGSMAVFLSHGIIDNSYFLVDLAFIFFLTFGLIQGVYDSFRAPSRV
jgi:O-antigen ligase